MTTVIRFLGKRVAIEQLYSAVLGVPQHTHKKSKMTKYSTMQQSTFFDEFQRRLTGVTEESCNVLAVYFSARAKPLQFNQD
jgi:hypothetical protein